MKAMKKETLFFVSAATFSMFLQMEKIFRAYYDEIKLIPKLNLKLFMKHKFESIQYHHICASHEMKDRIMNRFIVFKLKTKSKKDKPMTKVFASKTMAMHNNL